MQASRAAREAQQWRCVPLEPHARTDAYASRRGGERGRDTDLQPGELARVLDERGRDGRGRGARPRLRGRVGLEAVRGRAALDTHPRQRHRSDRRTRHGQRQTLIPTRRDQASRA